MFTKSLIQQHLERIDLLETFKQDLNYLMDKFIIENSVFGINRNGRSTEITTGYFIVDESFDNINDCIRGLKPNQFIQIENSLQPNNTNSHKKRIGNKSPTLLFLQLQIPPIFSYFYIFLIIFFVVFAIFIFQKFQQ
jgi:hypothetical protein